jgi:hypothetical protein
MMDFMRSISSLKQQVFYVEKSAVPTIKKQSSGHESVGSSPELQSESITPNSEVNDHSIELVQNSTQVVLDRRRTERLFIYPTSDKQVKNYFIEKGMPLNEKSMAAIQKNNTEFIRKKLFDELETRVGEITQRKEHTDIMRRKLHDELRIRVGERMQLEE